MHQKTGGRTLNCVDAEISPHKIGKPIPFKSNKLKDKIDPKELGPEQKQKLFTEPFVELISMSNSETCRCSNFVEFEGEGELDATGVTRMEKREKEQDNQLQPHARIQEEGGSIRENNPTQINGEGENWIFQILSWLCTQNQNLYRLTIAHEEDLAANAMEWVQANMIKLGQQFGVDFKGCKKEAYTMLAKLDQRREKEAGKGEKMKTIKSNNDVPKEVRNLFFDMNFKDGEPRSSGRVLALTNQ
ncbi:hypothetical protein MTR67_019596 [Solanum verrucosum]|uniref:Uncharacterized protein n=1 Tax=Solanum verrucosum TaxID=315347 RepID=A0AAF0TND5_SOLVR|nr:hypothetical protein MTR67_019596 [Solanum verrucosum]